MSQTTFAPQANGFAFRNWWVLDEAERQKLYDTFARYLKWSYIFGAITLGIAGMLLIPLGILRLRKKLERDMARGYGLCGGMCFTALDFHKTALPLPRGQGANDRPTGGTPLRNYIWRRQVDSLLTDGPRFLAWVIILNHVPSCWPFKGGTAWLLEQSRRELKKLKTHIDVGDPVPIGLVRQSLNVFDNHQILAIGYEEEDETEGTIYAYDPNCPNQVSTISLKFGEQSLEGQESCNLSAKLRGFFCQAYKPADPREAIA